MHPSIHPSSKHGTRVSGAPTSLTVPSGANLKAPGPPDLLSRGRAQRSSLNSTEHLIHMLQFGVAQGYPSTLPHPQLRPGASFLTAPRDGERVWPQGGRLSERALATCPRHLLRVMVTITEHLPGARCRCKHLTDGSRNCHQHSCRSGAICMTLYVAPGRKRPFLKLMRGQVKKEPLFPMYAT